MGHLDEEAGGKPSSRFFRKVIIDPALKEWIERILFSEGGATAEVVEAYEGIRRLGGGGSAYMHAMQARSYLEERTRITGREGRVYPLVGDLFLGAMEANLETLGPNLFEDHYVSMLGAYRLGDQPVKSVEGPLYAAELILEKAVLIFLGRGEEEAAPDGEESRRDKRRDLPFFDHGAPQGYGEKLGVFFERCDGVLEDVLDSLARGGPGAFPPGFFGYCAECRGALAGALRRWRGFHAAGEVGGLSDEDYLRRGLEVAEQSGYMPLIMYVKERLARFYEAHGGSCAAPWDVAAITRAYYEAGDLGLAQGNVEREVGAYMLAARRYTRSKGVFEAIHDRTAAARALMERARARIREGREPGCAREDLYMAVRLVLAHKMRLPRSQLPEIDEKGAVEFLRGKGYEIEADFYGGVLEGEAEGGRSSGAGGGAGED